MKRLVLVSLCLIALLSGCVSNDVSYNYEHSESVETAETADLELISADELIKRAGLKIEDYMGVNLDEFISFYRITSGNLKDYNVKVLLEKAQDIANSKNVSDVMQGDYPDRNSNFTSDIASIGFVESRGSSVCSSYIDVGTLTRWADASYVFDSLASKHGEKLDQDFVDTIIDNLSECGVFEMSSFNHDGPGVSESMSFSISIVYTDGTRYMLSRVGTSSDVLFDGYDEIKEMFMW